MRSRPAPRPKMKRPAQPQEEVVVEARSETPQRELEEPKPVGESMDGEMVGGWCGEWMEWMATWLVVRE